MVDEAIQSVLLAEEAVRVGVVALLRLLGQRPDVSAWRTRATTTKVITTGVYACTMPRL
jgi:hypothetical protein